MNLHIYYKNPQTQATGQITLLLKTFNNPPTTDEEVKAFFTKRHPDLVYIGHTFSNT